MRAILTVGTAMVLAACLMSGPPALALDFIYVVRHAEKADYWPPDRSLSAYQPLSDEGVARSQRLAEFLGDKGIATIYTSSTTRSLATAMPLAERTGAEVIADDATTDPTKMNAFLSALREAHASDKAILIVGHSNTVAPLLVALGAEKECFGRLGVFEARGGLWIEGYDDLWVVDVHRGGCAGIELVDGIDDAE